MLVEQGTGRLKSKWIDVDGLRLHARVSIAPVPATAPTVVLLHGMVISSSYMVPTAERLALTCRVFAVDLPGYGLSVKPPRVADVTGQSDALFAWMNAAGLDRSALLANSYGCQIAASFAARYPERVERLILTGPTVDPKGRTHRQVMGRWQKELVREPLPYLALQATDYAKAGMRRAFQTYRHMMADRIEENLPRVQAPTLVVRGSRDPIVPQRWAEEATALLPDGRLVVIPGAIHALNYASPLELARIVKPFLQDSHSSR